MTLGEINQLPREAFVKAVGWVFEHSPWIAEQAWATRPWHSLDELHQAMVICVQQASVEDQLSLIRAHPDLGARVKMAQASVLEQKGAGLDSLRIEEFAKIQLLNQQYTQKFGFPFILAVRGKSRHDIFISMEMRLHHSPEVELQAALAEIYQIARFRLADLVAEE
jgi:OHCU decarboxylase